MKVTLKKRKVVIVGGGITGLTTAFYLQQKAKALDELIEIIIIEASLRLGGKIHTVRKMGLSSNVAQNRFLIQVAMFVI